MKMKKILSIILIITTMFGFALVPSSVEAKTYKGFTYQIKNNKVEILSYNGKALTLKTPDYIKNYKVTKIRNDAFWGSNVKIITVGKYISSIQANTLISNKLTTIKVTKGNKKFSSKNGVLYNKKKTKLLQYPQYKKATIFKVPKTVKVIGESAFYHTIHLKKVVLNKNLEKISKEAFMYSEKLEKIIFSKNLKTIGNNAFTLCKKIKNVKIPKSVTNIKYMAFNACRGLKNLTIDSNKNLILGYEVFSKTGIEKLKIPKAKKYGDSMFLGCINLKSLTIPSYVTEIKDQDFMNCPKLKTVTIPKTVKKIGEYSFGYIGGYDENYPKLDDFTIKGYKGTAAEKYATDNGFKFVALNK